MNRLFAAGTAVAAASLTAASPSALAHGFAGQRFFPATLLVDDPFVADEMSLPTVVYNPKAEDGSRETDFGVDLAKRLTPDVGLTLHEEWEHVSAPGAPDVAGFGGLETGLQRQLFVDARHEAAAIAGISVAWANTGRVHALGAPDYTTITPAVGFGKGFGDLPDKLGFLRPIALTGSFSFDFPTRAESGGEAIPNTVNYGFAFEYSLPYLECCVKDVGLRRPFNQLTPLVEVAFSTAVNRGAGGQTVGTVQPGIIWSGRYIQVGAEAVIPATRAAGHGVGGLIQIHLYLDDLFPRSLGRPVSKW
jgi:hypothetical protein